MSAKAVSEYSGKELLYRHLQKLDFVATAEPIQLDETSSFDEATRNCEWLKKGKGVIKPDQLIKRRGKHGLVKLGAASELKEWFNAKKGQQVQVR
jgi:ATP citrate (pro-S)-lyase